MLPDDLRWETYPHLRTDSIWLHVGRASVAVVHCRIDGVWATTINRHLEPGRTATAKGPSREICMRRAERWAIANLARLRPEQPPVIRDPWAAGGRASLAADSAADTVAP